MYYDLDVGRHYIGLNWLKRSQVKLFTVVQAAPDAPQSLTTPPPPPVSQSNVNRQWLGSKHTDRRNYHSMKRELHRALTGMRKLFCTATESIFPFGARSCAPLWNNIPLSVRSATSVATFRRRLKTYLFDLAFPL